MPPQRKYNALTLSQKLQIITECRSRQSRANVSEKFGVPQATLPDKTFTIKGMDCHGGKHGKERVTLRLGANASGTEKLPVLLIGKSKHPRYLAGNVFDQVCVNQKGGFLSLFTMRLFFTGVTTC